MEDEKMTEEMNDSVQKEELSTISKVFKVFYEPSAVFRTLTRKIDWLVPLLIIAVIGGVMYYITMPVTSRGMKEKEFELIANKMADVLDDINNTELQATIKEELKALAQNFVIYNQPTY